MGKWLVILCMLLGMHAGAQTDTMRIQYDSLSRTGLKHWKYINNDDSNYAKLEYNDANWTVTESRISPEEDSISFDSVAWLRFHFTVDSNTVSKPLSLYISQYGASEIYLDGKRIGSIGKINGKKGSVYKTGQLEPTLFAVDRAGHHVIAIRYANYHKRRLNGGSYDGSYGFAASISHSVSHVGSMKATVGFVGYTFMLVGLFLSFFILHLFLYLYYRAERTNLYFSLFCFTLGLVMFMGVLSSISSSPWYMKIADDWIIVPLCILPIGLSGLSNELFGKKRYVFWAIVVLSTLSVFIGIDNTLRGIGGFVIVLLIAMMEAFVLTIIAMYEKVKGAKIVGTGILFFTLFFLGLVIASLVTGGFNINGSTLLGKILLLFAILAIVSIPLSMSIYLSWKFATMNKSLASQLKQVQDLSEKNLQQEQEKKRILEGQKEQLEKEVAERTSEIREEKRKSDELLLNILPEEVAEELKQRGTSEARYFDHVTVMFTDFVNFTKAGERFSPQELVNELDTCFKAFDEIISGYGIEKIKTIGDAYLCVSGLPSPDEQHAVNTVKAARDILEYMLQRKQQYPDKTFDIRIGIHSGAVVAGIVGVKKFAYDIWGDTVNTAARMESSGEPNKINISHATYELVEAQFNCTYRGEITAKNKGDMRMYFVDGKK